MAAVQVMGNDAAIGFAASQGNFQLNVFLPVSAYNFLLSARLLGDVCDSFRVHCVEGITPNVERMTANLHNSLMLVTCLTPRIGYEAAAACAKKALHDGTTLERGGAGPGVSDGGRKFRRDGTAGENGIREEYPAGDEKIRSRWDTLRFRDVYRTGGCAPKREEEASALLSMLLAMLETEEDRERFLKLHGTYEKKLYAVAVRVLGDRTAAEDAVQQTWAAAHPAVGPG